MINTEVLTVSQALFYTLILVSLGGYKVESIHEVVGIVDPNHLSTVIVIGFVCFLSTMTVSSIIYNKLSFMRSLPCYFESAVYFALIPKFFFFFAWVVNDIS